MPSTIEEINTKLKKALKITDRERKILYIISLAQFLQLEMQFEQIEKASGVSDDKSGD